MDNRKYLTDLISKFISQVAISLPDDVYKALSDLKNKENTPLANELYKCVFDNLELARELKKPICQDTGAIQFFIKAGTKFPYLDELEEVLRDAVLIATENTPLRHNIVETFTEKNTGNNIGKRYPWIEWELIPGSDSIYFDMYFAGGGSSLPGRSMVLMPSEGHQGIVKYVFDTITERGINACPPLIVGVGIGTCAPTAAILSKKALLRPVGTSNTDPNAAHLERIIKDGLNNIGMGPLGFKGKNCVMAVNVEYSDHHPATLGVGVSVGCWATRRGSITVNGDLSYEVHSHSEAATHE